MQQQLLELLRKEYPQPEVPGRYFWFTVEIVAKAKQSCRFRKKFKPYTDPKVAAYQRAFLLASKAAAVRFGFPFGYIGPLKMQTISVRGLKDRKSKKRGLFLEPKLTTPDTEQIEKPIKDAIQEAGVIDNDSNVYSTFQEKLYGPCNLVYVHMRAV